MQDIRLLDNSMQNINVKSIVASQIATPIREDSQENVSSKSLIKEREAETDHKTLRHEIEENRLGLHPYVKASIENWERHEDCKYTAFGHHKYSSAVSLASVANLSREQA